MLLRTMRSGFFKYLFLGFLLTGGIGLVMMDWTGSYKATGQSNEVAIIDGQPIRTIEFDRFVQRVLRSQNMDARSAYNVGLIDQILQLQITDALLNKAARDYGIIVDDAIVATQISKMLDPMVQQGTTKKETLARLLQSQGMSEADLVNNLKGDLSRRLLTETISANSYIPTALASDLYAYRREQRTVQAILLSSADTKDIKEPTDKELADYYELVNTNYPVPESRTFTVAVLSPDLLGEKATVTDAEVRAYYDDNQDAYRVDERRLLQQAILDTQAKADEVLKKAKDSNLEAAVKAVTGNTKAYTGDTGFEQQGLPQDLGTAIFAAPEKSYVGPIKSALGWHVVFVKTKQDAQVQPFEKVSADIRKEMLHNKTADSAYAATSRIEDRLAGGESLEDIAKDVDMSLVPAADVTLGMKDVAALKSLEKDQENILRSAFGLQEGETSPLSDLSDGRMYAVRMEKIKPRRIKELSEIKSDLIARWKTDQKNRANAAFVKDQIARLNKWDPTKVEAAFSDLAKSKGSKVQTFSGLTRESKPQDGLTEGNLGMIMGVPKGQFMAMPAANGIWMVRVTDIKTVKDKPAQKDIDETRTMLTKDGSQENLLIFVNDLQTKYKTVKHEKVLERMYASDPENQ